MPRINDLENEGVCNVCKSNPGVGCRSCDVPICTSCLKYEGNCERCVIVSNDRDLVRRSGWHVPASVLKGDRAEQYCKEYSLNDVEAEELKNLLEGVQETDEETLAAIIESRSNHNESEVLLDMMMSYHSKDLLPGSKETQTMLNYVRVLRSSGLNWLLEK